MSLKKICIKVLFEQVSFVLKILFVKKLFQSDLSLVLKMIVSFSQSLIWKLKPQVDLHINQAL